MKSVKSENKKEIFETMPVAKALASMAIPTIISQLITLIYNLADTFFIGRTNDPYKVGAATLSFVLVFFMNALANLFGVGGGSQISRLLGRGEEEETKRVSSFSIYGAVAVAAVYALAVFAFREPLLRLLGATDNTIGHARDYVGWVVVIGAVPTTLSMTMAHLLRSVGQAKKASFGLGLGGVLNIALDPLFMFVLLEPGNEVAGAALATMLSNCVVLIFFCVVFYRLRDKTALSASPKLIKPSRESLVAVFAVGLPSALATLLSCVSNSVINKLSSGHGDIQVAAVGVVKKIDMMPMSVGMGLCQGMVPLVAYNYAAKNYQRMKAFSNAARIAGIVFAAACILTFELSAESLVRFLIDEEKTVALGTNFLRIQCIATPFMITNVQMNYTFSAMGMGRQSLILSACRQGLMNLPLLFVMNACFGMYGIVWTQLIADVITLVVSFALYRRAYRKLHPAKI